MEKVKILIADDEARMRKLVSDFLKREGYVICEAEDGKKAIEVFSREPDIGLVILDVMMPGLDGWAVCRQIRENSDVPVMMLTAKSEEFDELFGFTLGVDEYISKPFSPMILVARVQALIRRSGKGKRGVKCFGPVRIDEAGHALYIHNEPVNLSPKEFELLVYLAENEEITLSREQILNYVWGYDYFGDERVVDTYIKKLRLKLGEAGDFIQTIRGIGYKFEVSR